MVKIHYVIFISILFILTSGLNGQDFKILGENSHQLLHKFLLRQIQQLDEKRQAEMQSVFSSRELVKKRKAYLKQTYLKLLGEFPEKTPLNPQITGVIEMEDYRIEKVVYESRPGHHITANLYIPTTGSGLYPAVLMACGHSNNGKALNVYQSMCILLAKNGFLTLIYDPICQGERYQGNFNFKRRTTAHEMLNYGAMLVGESIVKHEAWDGIRSLDYLLSRPEVDSSKPIGMTGNSGGGTQTTFLMALDDRIDVAAPSCYIMTRRRLYETIGPQDGCQWLPGEWAFGIDHADYIIMRAPRPTIILAAEQDFFEFAATQKAYAEAKKIYQILGEPEKVALFSYNDKHGFSRPRRQAGVQWMRRWILNDPSPVIEPELHIQPDSILQVTQTGQVIEEFPNEITVSDISLAKARSLEKDRKKFWKHNLTWCLTQIRQLLKVEKNRSSVQSKFLGQIEKQNYKIKKYLINSNDGFPIPALLFQPKKIQVKYSPILLVDDRGKTVEASQGGLIEKWISQGRIVLSIDVRGFGETEDNHYDSKFFNVNRRVIVMALHIGKPIMGQRINDVLSALDFLSGLKETNQSKFVIVGIGRAGPIVLHAAVLDNRIKQVVIKNSIKSWIDDVVARPTQPNLASYVVPGALKMYDLPDLAKLLAKNLVIQ